MTDGVAVGLPVLLCAGALQGSFMLPSKWMGGWAWENYWLIFATTAYLVCPWTLAFLTIPRLAEIYTGAPAGALISVAIYGTAWGIGALTFGLGVATIGLALGFAAILGVTATTGTLIPLFINPPDKFTLHQTLATAAALVLMLSGVAVCSLAGKWKEREPGKGRSYWQGVLISI